MTTAFVDAPRAEALDPYNVDTFRDAFRFEDTFSAVAGVDATEDLTCAGVTNAGGSIPVNIKLRAAGAMATLYTVEAQLGVSGTYRGIAVTNG